MDYTQEINEQMKIMKNLFIELAKIAKELETANKKHDLSTIEGLVSKRESIIERLEFIKRIAVPQLVRTFIVQKREVLPKELAQKQRELKQRQEKLVKVILASPILSNLIEISKFNNKGLLVIREDLSGAVEKIKLEITQPGHIPAIAAEIGDIQLQVNNGDLYNRELRECLHRPMREAANESDFNAGRHYFPFIDEKVGKQYASR